MEILKLLSTNEIVAQIISFLLLLFLLRIFAWKKLLGLLDQRRAKIASEFRQIEDAKAEIARVKSELEENLNRIEELKRQKIEEAAAKGRQIADQIRTEARQEALKLIDKAKEDIRDELSDAKDQLKVEIVGLAIGATEALIREKITAERDKKIIEEFIKNVGEAK
jgi:F-type H+-transporting ATPase subunit b